MSGNEGEPGDSCRKVGYRGSETVLQSRSYQQDRQTTPPTHLPTNPLAPQPFDHECSHHIQVFAKVAKTRRTTFPRNSIASQEQSGRWHSSLPSRRPTWLHFHQPTGPFLTHPPTPTVTVSPTRLPEDCGVVSLTGFQGRQDDIPGSWFHSFQGFFSRRF